MRRLGVVVALVLVVAYPASAAHKRAGWSPAIGAWLPSYGDSNNPWLEGHAAFIHRRDGFAYEGRALGLDGRFGEAPRDGTFFVYGNAGPPKGYVVYDPAHRIAFYGQGCCSWFDLVAAANVPPPPKPVVRRDLSALRTVRGVRLGMSPSDVMSVYGRARFTPLRTHRRMHLLAYTTWPPATTLATHASCEQFENFYFRGGRLVLIQLGNGC